jgi:hypothetical protein
VCFSSPGAFKTYANPMGWEEPGDSYPIIKEWGGAGAVPGPGKVCPLAKMWPI